MVREKVGKRTRRQIDHVVFRKSGWRFDDTNPVIRRPIICFRRILKISKRIACYGCDIGEIRFNVEGSDDDRLSNRPTIIPRQFANSDELDEIVAYEILNVLRDTVQTLINGRRCAYFENWIGLNRV